MTKTIVNGELCEVDFEWDGNCPHLVRAINKHGKKVMPDEVELEVLSETYKDDTIMNLAIDAHITLKEATENVNNWKFYTEVK